MGRARIEVEFAGMAGATPVGYRVAGGELVSPCPLPALRGLETGEPEPKGTKPTTAPSEPGGPFAPVREVVVPVGGRERSIRSRRGLAGYRLEVEGLGSFDISNAGESAAVESAAVDSVRIRVAAEASAGSPEADPEAPSEELLSFLLGPALGLAFALCGVWVLHASAVLRPGGTATGGGRRAVAFAGPSGVGKSTLARHLSTLPGGHWTILSDDALPLTLSQEGTPSGVVCDPRFPQPRWRGTVGPEAASPYPLEAIYVLRRPEEPEDADDVTTRPLTPALAALALARQTLGGALFDDELLRRHLEGCATVASRLPVVSLSYPLERGALDSVTRLLEARGRAAR